MKAPNRCVAVWLWVLCLSIVAAAQSPGSLLPLPQERWYFAGQANFVGQEHGGFPAAYSGTNSLLLIQESALSRVITVYLGYEIDGSTEILVQPEETGGSGLSSVLGLAGFTNLDAVRNPELSQLPYLARVMVHKVIDLGGGTEKIDRGPLSLFQELPARRLELRAGKFSLADFFDVNSAGSDSQHQFLNWTICNNGAYDYAADTRGYTWGLYAEYHTPLWGARFAEALMPKVANGEAMQWNPSVARSDNAEVEWHPNRAAVRLLFYDNEANMGVYRAAIDHFLAGLTPSPEITAHLPQPRRKYGAGLNMEKNLGDVTAFLRTGWEDDRVESFAYTEVGSTLSGGITLAGSHWRRPDDKLGLAAVSNGIGGDHRRYLALGGLGFLLGDGALSYGRENIVESFYTVALGRGFSLAPDVQHIVDPGYNRARGPVTVLTLRAHLDF